MVVISPSWDAVHSRRVIHDFLRCLVNRAMMQRFNPRGHLSLQPVAPLKGSRATRPLSQRINRACEPVHICSLWRLLCLRCWGFQGPGNRRRRDTIFRARRRSFMWPTSPFCGGGDLPGDRFGALITPTCHTFTAQQSSSEPLRSPLYRSSPWERRWVNN
jgi:hypothetical protein